MATDHQFNDYAEMLRHINIELAEHFDKLPGDVKALLVQKAAITQSAMRELAGLLEESHAQLRKVTDSCREWRDGFMLPLLDQTEDKVVENRVDVDDLRRIINEISKYIPDSKAGT